MTTSDDVRLSKRMSRALRHAPADFGLELAADGSVPLHDLVTALDSAKHPVNEADVLRVVSDSDKQRFAVFGARIRAQYGHSIADRIVKQQVTPNGPLFHATSPAAVNLIIGRGQGLQPMGRQYVHLTTDAHLALDAGRRKAPHPLLLEVDAVTTHADGVPFYVGHDRVTLADHIPAQYLTVLPADR